MSGFTSINVGATANDGTGDSLRVSQQAVNSNFLTATRSLPLVTDLASEAAASGYARIVQDLDRGGIFKAVNGGTVDNVKIYPSETSGWTWQRAYLTNINVKWFGATGDGSTDDTAAIQAAIDYLPNSSTSFPLVQCGGKIYFPDGIYNYTTLSVGSSDRCIAFEGQSVGSTILNKTADGIGIAVSGTNSGAGFTKQFEIKNIKLQSETLSQVSGSKLISIKYLHYFNIENVWCMGEDEAAIYIEDALDGVICKNRIDTANGSGQGFGVGVKLVRDGVGSIGAPNQISIWQNYIEDTTEAAVDVKGGEMVAIEENLIQSNQKSGIKFDWCNSIKINRNYFEGNGQSNVDFDADIKETGTTNFSASVGIQGNIFSSDGSTGDFYSVSLTDTRGGVINENDFRSGTANKIKFESGCLHLTISNNTAVVSPILVVDSGINLKAFNNKLRTADFWESVIDTQENILQNLPYAASVAPDLKLGRFVKINLTGDITINTPAGLIPGIYWILYLKQDATGGRAVTYSSDFRVRKKELRGSNEVSIYEFYYDADDGLQVEIGANAGEGIKNDNFLVIGNGLTGIIETSTANNATDKSSRFGGLHYDNAEEPVWAFTQSNTVSGNVLQIGGGFVTGNASTEIAFYSASNNTTTTGDKVARVIKTSTNGLTGLSLWDGGANSLHQVKVGANGTGPGGVGRALYIDNI